uniref:Sec-independent protein translocase protein TatB n=1 Tax=Parerythrobacter lutipelagi TaxID=1964208 RepID=UPI0010F65BD2|nr:Sec-independent protein translocase protein TatB [Parerythrobacter lutipelagi]
MFDIGASELLLIVVVAILVIGPKDMPAALRTAGRLIGKIRRTSAHFRSGFDAMVREAEMEEMEEKWKAQNARIMAETPAGEMGPLPPPDGASAESAALPGAADETADDKIPEDPKAV